MIERWERFGPEGGAAGAALLERLGLTTIDRAVEAAAARGRTLSTDRQSAAVALPGDPPLLLKWRNVRTGRRLRTWRRSSHERKEAVAMARAAGLGIAAPPVLAVAERRSAGILRAALQIRRFLVDHDPARERLAGEGGAGLARRLAEALAEWHGRGFRHGNAYPKNVLVPRGEGPLVPIGCPAARFVRAGARADRARWKDVAQMVVGVREVLSDLDEARWIATYARASGLEADGVLPRVGRLAATVRRKKARRLATLPVREPHGPPPPAPIPPAPGVPCRVGPARLRATGRNLRTWGA